MSEGHILEKQKTRAGLYADVFSIQCILFFFIILWCSVCILTPEQQLAFSQKKCYLLSIADTTYHSDSISHAVQLQHFYL